MRMLGDDSPETFQNFSHSLMELGFTSIATQDFGKDGLNFFIDLGQDFPLTE
jgi:hypothetical protein